MRLLRPAALEGRFGRPKEPAFHTDVAEFRGINRKHHRQWLIVARPHSGLFDDDRMPIATAVAWFHDCDGGEFAYYPDGADGTPRAHRVRFNTALPVDTGSVFHSVDRLRKTGEPVGCLRPGVRLMPRDGDDRVVPNGDREVPRYRWPPLRPSVSWKPYGLRDQAKREAWSCHGDDPDPGTVVDRLLDDLREKRILEGDRPTDDDLVEIVIEGYIRFPAPVAA